MRLKVMTATSVIALGLVSATYAADIDKAGANAIHDSLTKLLPKDAVAKDFVTVKPAGTRYEIIYDFAKLLKKAKSQNFTISGLVPLSMFVTPRDDGLWTVEGNNSFNVSGHFKAPKQPRTDFSYMIDSAVFAGIFDPEISYLRSGDFSTKAISFSSATDAEKVSAGFDSMNYKLTSTDSAVAGRRNFASSGTASAFVEKITSGTMAPVEIRADTFDFAAAVNGAPAKAIRDILFFALERADKQELDRADSEKLRGMLHESFPLLTSLTETFTFNDLTVSSAGGNGGAKSVNYNLAVDGPSNAMRMGFGLAADQIRFDSALIPAGYSAFVPEAMELQFAVPNMDFAAFGDEVMKINFADPSSSDQVGKDAVDKLFKNGELLIEFPKVSAVSKVYDAEISGSVRGRPGATKEYAMDASILVRDFDKTISAVQELAKTNPDLSQISFGMLMAKGFAKTDPDGRQRWDINIARNGAITINGQVIKGAD